MRLLRSSPASPASALALVTVAILAAAPVRSVTAQVVIPGTDAARTAAAPQSPGLLDNLREQTVRTADGYLPPLATRGFQGGYPHCRGTIAIPADLALVVPANKPAFVDAWQHVVGASTPRYALMTLSAGRTDTLRLAMTDARCAEGQTGSYPMELRLIGRTADGIPVALHGDDIRGESPVDEWRATMVYLVLPDGTLDRALLHHDCREDGVDQRCDWSIGSDGAYRQALRRDELATTQARSASGRAAARRRAATIQAKGWPADVAAEVLARHVTVGMSPAQVRAAWGEPTRIIAPTGGTAERTHWVYGVGAYVSFADGVVAAVQQ